MLIALHPKFFVALGFVVALEEGEADYQDQQSRMDAGKKSRGGSTPTRRNLEGCRGHFSTLSPGSRPLTSTRSDADEKFLPPDVNERNFSTLNLGNNIAKESISTGAEEARVFSTLAANKRLAADEKSKGFWAPNVD
jgi:hypothetical protein